MCDLIFDLICDLIFDLICDLICDLREEHIVPFAVLRDNVFYRRVARQCVLSSCYETMCSRETEAMKQSEEAKKRRSKKRKAKKRRSEARVGRRV